LAQLPAFTTHSGLKRPSQGFVLLDPTTGDPADPVTNFTNSAATTNAKLLLTGPTILHSVQASNLNAALRYLKLYNKATAPVPATDTPVMVIPIPAGGAAAVNLNFGNLGAKFPLGLGMALTVNAIDTDATAVAAGEIKTAISYL
jgi:hypothetical protein